MALTSITTTRGHWSALLVATIALSATGCASAPPAPVASLQAAQQAITAAERLDAGHSAPGELGEARSKLLAANAAVDNKKMVSADHLALESRASAELAAAKTASVKALAENVAIRTGNAAMADELNRKVGETN
jgi:hypothetical protein